MEYFQEFSHDFYVFSEDFSNATQSKNDTYYFDFQFWFMGFLKSDPFAEWEFAWIWSKFITNWIKNRLIWIQFWNKLKINRTKILLKMKMFFWNKVTCRVSIKHQIILNGCVVVIILIKKKLVHILWIRLDLKQIHRNSMKHRLMWIQFRERKLKSTEQEHCWKWNYFSQIREDVRYLQK